tara:strand:+ start:614 stop:1591 length:978 start_codon:yes stop_codon:yes gene_type:complete
MFDYHIPRLTSYKDAVRHEANVVPIRGRRHECKPLGKRSTAWFQIKASQKGSTKRIQVGTHGWSDGDINPIVTYNADNTITLRTNSYIFGCASWRSVLFDLTGIEVVICGRKLWIQDLRDGFWYPMPRTSGIRFAQYEQSGYRARYNVIRKLAKPEKTYVNRKEMKKARESVQPFTDYVEGMYKLIGVVVPADHNNELHVSIDAMIDRTEGKGSMAGRDVFPIKDAYQLVMKVVTGKATSHEEYANAMEVLSARAYLCDRSYMFYYLHEDDYRRKHKTITMSKFKRTLSNMLIVASKKKVLYTKKVLAKSPFYDRNSSERASQNI